MPNRNTVPKSYWDEVRKYDQRLFDRHSKWRFPTKIAEVTWQDKQYPEDVTHAVRYQSIHAGLSLPKFFPQVCNVLMLTHPESEANDLPDSVRYDANLLDDCERLEVSTTIYSDDDWRRIEKAGEAALTAIVIRENFERHTTKRRMGLLRPNTQEYELFLEHLMIGAESD